MLPTPACLFLACVPQSPQAMAVQSKQPFITPYGGEKNCSLAEPFPGPFQSWLTFPLAWELQSSGDLVPLLLKGRTHFKRQSGSSANWS